MSEHTRGPWRDCEVDVFGDHTITQDDGGLAIAAVVTNLRKEEEVSANARLIAAAPELLVAAKKTLENWDSFDGGFVRQWLEEAIAKAERSSG